MGEKMMPERIWAQAFAGVRDSGSWASAEGFGGAEYIRADLHTARIAELEAECERFCDQAQDADGLRYNADKRAEAAEAQVAKLVEAGHAYLDQWRPRAIHPDDFAASERFLAALSAVKREAGE